MSTSAIILAGGRSQRLGQPKELVKVSGLTLLQSTVTACADSDRVVVVGPTRADLDQRVIQVREDPPFAGPVAAIRAGAAELSGRGTVLVLACDMPRIGEVVGQLLNEAHRSAAADIVMLRDRREVQPLAALWRLDSLRQALSSHSDNTSVRSLAEGLRCDIAEVSDATTHDIDEPADLAVLWPSGDVASAMLTSPSVVPATAPVATVAQALASSHVHLAIVTDGARVVSTVQSEDLAAAPDDMRAADIGALDGRTAPPDADLQAVASEMVALGQRRRVVVDAEANLLGLLCLNRRGDGFCSDEDVAARAHERARRTRSGR